MCVITLVRWNSSYSYGTFLIAANLRAFSISISGTDNFGVTE
jgi:hypothetical protein